MKSKFVFSSSSLFIGLFLFFFTENVCSQESADNWTLKQARQWTQKQEWANGLKAMPHKTTDYQEFASQYHKNQKVWDKTFQWLATHDLANMPAGRYEVDGEHCYINVQDATTQDVSKRKIEAHRHGIDLHLIHTFDILLHGILNGCDIHLPFCQRFQNHIQCCCFTASGRSCNIDDSMRHLHHTTHFRIIIRIHAVLLFIQNRRIAVQKTQNSFFTIYS